MAEFVVGGAALCHKDRFVTIRTNADTVHLQLLCKFCNGVAIDNESPVPFRELSADRGGDLHKLQQIPIQVQALWVFNLEFRQDGRLCDLVLLCAEQIDQLDCLSTSHDVIGGTCLIADAQFLSNPYAVFTRGHCSSFRIQLNPVNGHNHADLLLFHTIYLPASRMFVTVLTGSKSSSGTFRTSPSSPDSIRRIASAISETLFWQNT